MSKMKNCFIFKTIYWRQIFLFGFLNAHRIGSHNLKIKFLSVFNFGLSVCFAQQACLTKQIELQIQVWTSGVFSILWWFRLIGFGSRRVMVQLMGFFFFFFLENVVQLIGGSKRFTMNTKQIEYGRIFGSYWVKWAGY